MMATLDKVFAILFELPLNQFQIRLHSLDIKREKSWLPGLFIAVFLTAVAVIL